MVPRSNNMYSFLFLLLMDLTDFMSCRDSSKWRVLTTTCYERMSVCMIRSRCEPHLCDVRLHFNITRPDAFVSSALDFAQNDTLLHTSYYRKTGGELLSHELAWTNVKPRSRSASSCATIAYEIDAPF